MTTDGHLAPLPLAGGAGQIENRPDIGEVEPDDLRMLHIMTTSARVAAWSHAPRP